MPSDLIGAPQWERARGALLGLAYGDALGMPTQCLSPTEIAATYGAIRGLVGASPTQPIAPGAPAGMVTDDTEQALLLAARIIAGQGHIDVRAFADDLVTWEADMRARGSLDLLGPSTKRALTELQAGAEIGTTGLEGTTNGAAMRVAPVGIARSTTNVAAFSELVAQSCCVTHNTVHGFESAALVAGAVSLGIDGLGVRDAVDAVVQIVADLPPSGAWNPKASVLARTVTALEAVEQIPARLVPQWLASTVGTSVEANEAIPTAFTLAWHFHDQPTLALRVAASLGGDTDTIAAIAGAILGACLGVDAFPKQDLELIQEVNTLCVDEYVEGLLAIRLGTA